MPTLINGAQVSDPRLGRIVQYDQRNRNFPIRRVLPTPLTPRSMTWLCSAYLDQGSVGACVGFCISHEGVARPDIVPGISYEVAMEVYKRAQELDPWPGTDYEGTSVLAGLKAGVERGWYQEFRWAFSLNDLILGVGHHGPAVLGVNWYDSMFTPDPDGMLHVNGSIAGGHSLLAVGVSIPKQKFRLHNSWGKSFGLLGDCFISFADMEKLLLEQGEAAFPRPPSRGAKIQRR